MLKLLVLILINGNDKGYLKEVIIMYLTNLIPATHVLIVQLIPSLITLAAISLPLMTSKYFTITSLTANRKQFSFVSDFSDRHDLRCIATQTKLAELPENPTKLM